MKSFRSLGKSYLLLSHRSCLHKTNQAHFRKYSTYSKLINYIHNYYQPNVTSANQLNNFND